MHTGIIPVLSKINPLDPLGEARMSKTVKISFETPIKPFGLSVSLQMIQ
jgi:hypothetical protein